MGSNELILLLASYYLWDDPPVMFLCEEFESLGCCWKVLPRIQIFRSTVQFPFCMVNILCLPILGSHGSSSDRMGKPDDMVIFMDP